jgi:hypothetical protein
VSNASAPAVRSTAFDDYVARIEAHLGRLAQGHDALGHLFAIERLARSARADGWAALREAERGRQLP